MFDDVWDRVKKTVTPLGQPRGNIGAASSLRSTAVFDTLDLHGMTIQTAYERSMQFINSVRLEKIKSVTIITGKSGMIRQEFPTWMDNHPGVRKYQALNEGSFKIYIKKQ